MNTKKHTHTHRDEKKTRVLGALYARKLSRSDRCLRSLHYEESSDNISNGYLVHERGPREVLDGFPRRKIWEEETRKDPIYLKAIVASEEKKKQCSL